MKVYLLIALTTYLLSALVNLYVYNEVTSDKKGVIISTIISLVLIIQVGILSTSLLSM